DGYGRQQGGAYRDRGHQDRRAGDGAAHRGPRDPGVRGGRSHRGFPAGEHVRPPADPAYRRRTRRGAQTDHRPRRTRQGPRRRRSRRLTGRASGAGVRKGTPSTWPARCRVALGSGAKASGSPGPRPPVGRRAAGHSVLNRPDVRHSAGLGEARQQPGLAGLLTGGGSPSAAGRRSARVADRPGIRWTGPAGAPRSRVLPGTSTRRQRMTVETGTEPQRRHILLELGFATTRVGEELHGSATITPQMHVPGTDRLRTSVLATWTDTVTGLLAALTLGPRVPVTLELDVHLYRPAPSSGEVRAVGRTIKAGRSVFVAEVEWTVDGEPFAFGGGSFMVSPNEELRLPEQMSIDMPVTGRLLAVPLAERAGCERRAPGTAVLPRTDDGLNA